jgi:hypothetical protein
MDSLSEAVSSPLLIGRLEVSVHCRRFTSTRYGALPKLFVCQYSVGYMQVAVALPLKTEIPYIMAVSKLFGSAAWMSFGPAAMSILCLASPVERCLNLQSDPVYYDSLKGRYF